MRTARAYCRAGLVLAAVAIFIVRPAAVAALETDQFAAWLRPLADATPMINARLNLEIARALAELQRPGDPPPTCDAIARAVHRRLTFEIFQPLEMWVAQSPLVDQFPARGDAAHTFTIHSIYRHHGPLDAGMWMPLSPTIEVGGIRLGTDKLAHMVSTGWKYRTAYLRRIRAGRTEEEAVLGAIRWGIFEERSINGSLGSGIFSRADLEADYEGMRFYLGLCAGSDPILVLEGGRWRFRRTFDLGDHVTPEWDESYQLSVYTRSRWRKAGPQIAAACAALDEPAVRSRFERYRALDGVTPTEEVVDALVAKGKLPDDRPFALASVCPQAESLPPPSGTPPSRSVPAVAPDPALTAEIVALEEDRERRVFALWGAGVVYPRSASASLGALVATVPRTDDCRSVCDLRGPTVQVALGTTGGQVSAGWARAIAETDRSRRLLADVYLAYGLRAAVVRTWGDAPRTLRSTTLAGIEGTFTVARVSFTLGVLGRLDGGGPHDRWIVSGGLGLGF